MVPLTPRRRHGRTPTSAPDNDLRDRVHRAAEPLLRALVVVLAKAAKWCKEEPPPYPCANVDDLYDAADEDGAMQDAREDVRCSGEETGLEAEWSRHYESNAVATQLPDGTWVGWTYWYGGGKHGQPESIPWMEHAYDVTPREETRVVRVFSREGAESGR